jgi:tRNA pseudouridine65 synthase
MKILVQEKDYLALHKPSGFVTYADSPEQKKISARDVAEKQTKRKLFPVHRIDKDTCGVLVFAASPAMAKNLTALFRTRVVKKHYVAVVHGLAPERGTIDTPLTKHKEKVREAAETDFVRLAEVRVEWDGETREYSLVRCEPRTGRYHQIRRHLRGIGHPIVGDPEYGNGWDNRAFRERFGVERTLLSAVNLAFPDRARQKMVRISTRPDEDFQRVLKAFGWEIPKAKP